MRVRPYIRHALVAASAAVLACSVGIIDSSISHADTTAGVLTGEGGDAMSPVMQSLLNDDANQLMPDFGSYTNVDVDSAISDFVGSGPGTFGADFVVSERQLTPTETATATANGRAFAYIPFAATPVALMTLVPNSTWDGSATINPSQFCDNIPLTLVQLDGIYGSISPQYSSWADSRLTAPASCAAAQEAISKWGNLDPTMENEALESLLDSTPASESSFAAGLNSNSGANTTSTMPTESWPFPQTAISGGDQTTLGKLIALNQASNVPGTVAANIALGAIMPIASVWTGDPLGPVWNLPTAALQNAQGSFVAPSATAAEAAENDATLAATSDPTTNNLVTFNASTTDAAAYNNFMMLQSYLVVPTNGLSSDKALALAQFVRFALGAQGQKDIAALGAAPATPAMVTAGLKVAQQLNVEAATESTGTTTTDPDCSSTTTTTTVPTSTSTAPTSTTTSTTSGSTTTTTASDCTTSSTSTTLPDCTTTSTVAPTSTTTSSPSTTTSTTPASSTTTTVSAQSTTTTAPDCTTTSTTATSPTTTTSPSCVASTPSPTTTSIPGTTTSTVAPSSATTTSSPTSTSTTASTSTTTTASTTTTSTDPTTTTTTTPSASDMSTTSTSTDPSTTTTTAPSTSTTTAPTTTTTTLPDTSTTTTSECPATTTTLADDSGDSGVTTGAATGDGSGDLAFTGSNPVPLVGLGLALFILGELGLRRLRKRGSL